MAERVLTLKELNRATLARQLLLERKQRRRARRRSSGSPGMQAQWPPSPYVGLWSRVDGFNARRSSGRSVHGEVVKPSVMRGTLHLVTRRDYPRLLVGAARHADVVRRRRISRTR